MQSALPVALSAQIALQKRLDTIANNVANSRTVGFRAEEVKFETVLSQASADPTAFSSKGDTYISTRGGELVSTGNSLDMAAAGDAWFAIQGKNGTVYTRDGRMRISEQGDVLTVNGEPFLDVGGAPIQIDPGAGPITIARDGMITQNGAQLGAVGLFQIPATAQLERAGTSGVTSNLPAIPVLDFGEAGVMQGFVEQANVNPVMEMTKLITVQRAFESAANLVDTSERSLNDAVRDLGETS
ncbi:flagellar basal-body rod protein FlgF [Consotaella salsifontis]|uniref:Flagellar basal-body rod protein FlgF n=1 Tax=Consotaella salsifontis TaxID=1365950 RepID=A0A1T4NQ05_9HYPH|nr:flagellar basal-body rod protein FlgF [Consotaella salsifontis]SJZ81401.1 flagellar basal-body rod protein FlgF [Consotaella salsifontis]